MTASQTRRNALSAAFADDRDCQLLLGHLGHQDAPKRKAALADELGWNERDVKRVVRQCRLNGWLVLSGNDGYYLDGDPEVWLRRQRSQIFSMWRTYKAVRNNWRRQQAAAVHQLTWTDAA